MSTTLQKTALRVAKIIAGAVWFFCVIGIIVAGTLVGKSHRVFGIGCLIVGFIVFLLGLYSSSPRFEAAGTKRSWADFKVWLRESVSETWQAVRTFLKGAMRIAVLVGVGWLVVAGYQQLDYSGYITHEHNTPVWIHGDWIEGEFRDCGMQTTTSPYGIVLSPDVRAELPRLFCGNNWEGAGAVEFEFSMPDADQTAVQDALYHGGDWSQLDDKFHILPIRYFGRIDRPDEVYISWRCQRLRESLECKALN